MHLVELDISDVRNLTNIHMDCGPGINVISGKNAAGKTAVLEGIHLLARVSSFRTPRINDVIQHGKSQLSIRARLSDQGNNKIVTGLEKSRQATKIRFNGTNVNKRSEQARNLPVLTVSPESHQLLNGTPRERRHWLDWSMFHVEPAYMENWQNYHHALRQRNGLLRQPTNQTQFNVWEEMLANSAVLIRRARKTYVNRIKACITQIANSSIGEISIDLRTEEQGQETIMSALKQQRKSDLMAGYTQQGQHREDVVFNIEGREASRTLSRGEGKLFVLFLFMAQALEYKAIKQQQPIMLIDDLSAELDGEARKRILKQLQHQGLQAFITTTNPETLEIGQETHRRFHVEQGCLAAMAAQ
jgi:DNA replication and repair protein RecF